MTNNVKITMLDILSILLPGGALVGILYKCGWLSKILDEDQDTKNWIFVAVLLGASYVLGHFIFLIASFLDSIVYDKVTRVFWNDNRLVSYVIELKTKVSGIRDPKVINAFKWCLGWLLENKPEMHAEVERQIAESKFFRSLFVVLLMGAVAFFASSVDESQIAITFLCLSPLCLIRYLTQRRKSVESAYQFVLIASHTKFDPSPDYEILQDVNRNNLYPCKQRDEVGVEAWKKRLREFFCFFRKVGEIFLLFVPGYRGAGGKSGKSWELRWFFTDSESAGNDAIAEWFQKAGHKMFAHPQNMEDRYFYLEAGHTDLNVKLRNNSIEVKKLLEAHTKDDRYATVQGERYTKERWMRPKMPAYKFSKMMEAIREGRYDWIDVKKKRYAFKIGPSGKLFPVTAPLARGCQVEYTELELEGKKYYTFALEWFGRSDTDLPERLLNDILGATELTKAELASYKAFLEKFREKKK